MPRTFIRQDSQVRRSDVYDDTVVLNETNFETNPVSIEDDLNALRSKVSYLQDVQAGDWHAAQTAPAALEAGSLRGIDNLNDALHAIEKKRVLREVHSLTDVTVGSGVNFVVLGTGELPAKLTAALGAVTSLGTVVAAHSGAFGSTHSLVEVGGTNAINPGNLMVIVDGASRDPILSDGRTVYGLLHAESGISDGTTITDTTTTRVQISFVRINAAGNDLEAVPFADIEDEVINYCTRERVRLEDLNEGDFLGGAIVDVPAGVIVDRQSSYTGQGATIVTTAAAATLDLGSGLTWEIGDLASAMMLQLIEGSAGGTSQFNIGAAVDELDIDAILVNLASGATVNSGGTRPITLGVTDGYIASTAGNLGLRAAAELLLDDSNQTGSTWAQVAGIKLSENTAEWDAVDAEFGEVSILNMLVQAANSGIRARIQAVITADINADINASGPANDNNLDVNLGDLSGGDFITDYDFYINGSLLRNGANAAANEDVYPGTSLANGQVKFEFKLKSSGPDVLTLVKWVA